MEGIFFFFVVAASVGSLVSDILMGAGNGYQND